MQRWHLQYKLCLLTRCYRRGVDQAFAEQEAFQSDCMHLIVTTFRGDNYSISQIHILFYLIIATVIPLKPLACRVAWRICSTRARCSYGFCHCGRPGWFMLIMSYCWPVHIQRRMTCWGLLFVIDAGGLDNKVSWLSLQLILSNWQAPQSPLACQFPFSGWLGPEYFGAWSN